MNTTIRQEAKPDREAIRLVHEGAFGQTAEAELVDALRDGGFFRLSLVAEYDGRVVGHVLFCDLIIEETKKPIRTVALAPVAVMPEYQNRGIGAALIQQGIRMCGEQNVDIIFVVGDPNYYRRFGFSSDLGACFRTPYPGEAFMAHELRSGAATEGSGEVMYPAPFANI